MNAFLSLLGRLCLSAIFLGSLVNKVTDFDGTQAMMESVGMPNAQIMLIGAIVLLVFGGMSVVLGFKTRVGAWLLIVFILPATYYFHFDFGDEVQQIHFLKNVAILGGLLVLAANGAGRYSLDARRAAGKA